MHFPICIDDVLTQTKSSKFEDLVCTRGLVHKIAVEGQPKVQSSIGRIQHNGLYMKGRLEERLFFALLWPLGSAVH